MAVPILSTKDNTERRGGTERKMMGKRQIEKNDKVSGERTG